MAAVMRLVEQAVSDGAGFILLPEVVMTGLSNNDDPAHDLPLGEPVPGPATDAFGAFCTRKRVWLGFGLLEREEAFLFDSAIVIGPDGLIHLKYRCNNPCWHDRNADPLVYRQGTEIAKAETPIGSAAFLVCGDLFDDNVVDRFQALKPDVLLFPIACGYETCKDVSMAQRLWDEQEMPKYITHIGKAGALTLMVNSVGHPTLAHDNGFGGARGQRYEETAAIFEAQYLDKVEFQTPAGRALAAEKKAYTKDFLNRLREEW